MTDGTPSDLSENRYEVYVGNLPWWATYDDIEESFITVGIFDTLHLKIVEDLFTGMSKGFCHAAFASEASKIVALKKLPKNLILGFEVEVTEVTRVEFERFVARYQCSQVCQRGNVKPVFELDALTVKLPIPSPSPNLVPLKQVKNHLSPNQPQPIPPPKAIRWIDPKLEFIHNQDRAVCMRAVTKALKLILVQDVAGAIETIWMASEVVRASCQEYFRVPLLKGLFILLEVLDMRKHWQSNSDPKSGAVQKVTRKDLCMKCLAQVVFRVMENVFEMKYTFAMFRIEVFHEALAASVPGTKEILAFLEDLAELIAPHLGMNHQYGFRNPEPWFPFCKGIIAIAVSKAIDELIEARISFAVGALRAAKSSLNHPDCIPFLGILDDLIKILEEAFGNEDN